jgi:TfoX/Sxy family transcriptional regulator of competence genes
MTDDETLARVRRMLARRDDVVEKRMVGGLSFSVGDRMFCGVTGRGLLVRVGADAVAAATAEPHVTRMTLGGKPLAAFVLVEPAGYADDAALEAWLARGLAFVAA